MKDLDADAAVQSLMFRLRDWGIVDPAPKARAYIDDLQSRGWKCRAEAPRVQPPKRHEECGTHPGQYALSCGGCAADRKEAREAVQQRDAGQRRLDRAEALTAIRGQLATTRATLCRHGANPCATCVREETNEEAAK